LRHQVQEDADSQLRQQLSQLAATDDDYWSFHGNARREHGHALMQYPAMMVPQMVRALLNTIAGADPTVRKIGDPFSGSGTVLTESMLRGYQYFGCDINPLAVLLCKVKRGPFHLEAVAERAEEAIAAAKRDDGNSIGISFPKRDKWFSERARIRLARIRRAIVAEGSLWVRRFLWVALAETVRLTSNSRTSTFKLHKRTLADRRRRRPDPVVVFERLVNRNLQHLRSLAKRIDSNLVRGHYAQRVEIALGDIRRLRRACDPLCDVIITSPPYGDNATTVPYGQYSYLPLQWIALGDIHPTANAEYLRTTHEIDSRSLGGKRSVPADVIAKLELLSPTFAATVAKLSKEPRDRAGRVAAFVRDLNQCLPSVLSALRPSGVMVWVLGNRQVAGRPVPLDCILRELLEREGAVFITSLQRRIPSKRMAIRNSIANTMRSETILVMRKGKS
jgi:hypothetical protein